LDTVMKDITANPHAISSEVQPEEEAVEWALRSMSLAKCMLS
jgi:hypothetical protein